MSDYAKFYCNLSRRYMVTPRTTRDAFREADYAIAIERDRPMVGVTSSDAMALVVLAITCLAIGFLLASVLN